MIKIPFTFYIDNNKEEPDWESLGIAKPDDFQSETLKQVADVLVNPMVINYVEPVIDGEGSYISLMEKEWHSPLSVDEIADILNGTITIKA
jgi:hypothetical protein